MTRFTKKLFASLALALAFVTVADFVLASNTPAEAAARKSKKTTASKNKKQTSKTSSTSKQTKKTATATRAASGKTFSTPEELEKYAQKGTLQFFPEYGCYKLVLNETITVSECATVIITKGTRAYKAGATAKTGNRVSKGTAIKVFFKAIDQQPAAVETVKEAVK